MNFTQNAGMADGMTLNAAWRTNWNETDKSRSWHKRKAGAQKKAGRTTAPRPWRL